MESRKLARAVSINNLLNKKYELLPFEGEWEEAFAKPSAAGVWFVYGDSSNGKTSFAMQLVKYLASLDLRVNYLSMEEGTDHTMREAVKRAGLTEAKSHIRILEPESPDELKERLRKHKSCDVVLIDTVQYWVEMYGFKFRDFLAMKREFPGKLFIFMSHVKKGDPDGSVATKIMRDASLKINVIGFRAISKGRYIGKTGYYTVWDEGAENFWNN